jgi:hypothetical protein
MAEGVGASVVVRAARPALAFGTVLLASGVAGQAEAQAAGKIRRPQSKSMYFSSEARLLMACRPAGSPNPAPMVRAMPPVQPQQALRHAGRQHG